MVNIPILSNLDDLAAAIADPPPTRPFERAVGEFGRTVCDRWSAAADPGPGGYPGLVGTVCQPYLDGLGYDSPVEVPPFIGGQCAASYGLSGNVEFDIFIGSTGGTTTGTSDVSGSANLTGPISAVSFRYDTPGSSGNRRWLMDVTTSAGVVEGYRSFLNPIDTNAVSNARFTGTLYRGDGLPDNCGNPPGNFEPGDNPAPDPGPLPPGTGPQIDIRGNPVLVLPPNFSLNPNFDIGFDVGEISFGGGGGLGDEPPLPGEELPGSNGGAGGADDEFGPPPDGERWVGVCIKISARPIGSGSIPGSEPYDVYPTIVGNARLIFASNSAVGADTAVRVQGKETCLWEPVTGLRPTGIFVNLLPGFTYTRTPYSVPETVE